MRTGGLTDAVVTSSLLESVRIKTQFAKKISTVLIVAFYVSFVELRFIEYFYFGQIRQLRFLTFTKIFTGVPKITLTSPLVHWLYHMPSDSSLKCS